MVIKRQQQDTSTVKEFKLPKQEEPSDVFNLETQKKSLLSYNEEIRTSKSIIISDDGRLKIPVFTANPAVCVIGEIAFIGGIMKVCSSTNTWTNI